MDLQREIGILKKQIEDKSKADNVEKHRLRVALEEATAKLKADEAYFDRLVKENERLKAANRQNGARPSRSHSSSLESPARSSSPAHSAGVSESPGHGEHPNTAPSGAFAYGNAGIDAPDRPAAGHSPTRAVAAVQQPSSRDHSPLRADASSQGRPPSNNPGPSGRPAELGALANGDGATSLPLPGRARGSGRWQSPSVSGADQPTLPASREASQIGRHSSPAALGQGGYSNLRTSSPLGRPQEAGRSQNYRSSADPGQMLALLGPASGRNTSELMHPDDMQRFGSEMEARELAGTLSRVLDELEPLRALLPLLGRLPTALSALDSLPRIQENASRALQMTAQNKEELRTVSRMVAVGSDIIDQNRKTVSQLQERMAKEEAEGQARAAASRAATQRVDANMTALRREQKQSAQSVQSMQNELGSLQTAQMPARLSDMEAEIAALKAQIAAQSRPEQQQPSAAVRHVPAPAPPTGPFPAAPRPLDPRPLMALHPSAAAPVRAVASAPAAAATAPQPGKIIGSSWPPSQQQHRSPTSLSAVQPFSAAAPQLSIPFQLLMPTPAASAQVLTTLPPPQSMSVPASSSMQAPHAAQPSTGQQQSAVAHPAGGQKQPASGQDGASAGSKPATLVPARQGLAEFGAAAKLGAGSPGSQGVSSLEQASTAMALKLPAVPAPSPALLWQPSTSPVLLRPAADGSQQANAMAPRQVEVDMTQRDNRHPFQDTCGACEAAFNSEVQYFWHLNSKEHREVLTSNAHTYQAPSQEVKAFRDQFDWTCRVCDRSFANLKAYAAHCTQSKAHESKLAAKIKSLAPKGRKTKARPFSSGKVVRDAWLAAQRGYYSQPADDDRDPSPTVRHISIDRDPFRASPAGQQAGEAAGSPHAAAAAAPNLPPQRSREQSVEEGELIPGQSPRATAGPVPGAGVAQPPSISAPEAQQAGASGAAGDGAVAMEIDSDRAVSEEPGPGQLPRSSQEALTQQQQAARQVYALQRQMKEQKRQEQLQRLNRSLGFAAPAASAAPITAPALSPPSLPLQQPSSPVASSAAPTELLQSAGAPGTVLAATPASTGPPAGTASSAVSAQGFGSPQAVHPAASAAPPSAGAAAAILAPVAAAGNAVADLMLPDVTAPLVSPTAAVVTAVPVEQHGEAAATTSAAMAGDKSSSQQAEAAQAAATQPAASSAAPGGGAAVTGLAVVAAADALVGALAAQAAPDVSFSRTAQEFLDGLSWSQPSPAPSESAPSTGTAVPREPVSASAQPTVVVQPVGQDAVPFGAAAREKLEGTTQEDTPAAAAAATLSVPELGESVQTGQPPEAQTAEAASEAAPAGMQGEAEAPISSAPATAGQEQVPSGTSMADVPAAVAQMEQSAAKALPSSAPLHEPPSPVVMDAAQTPMGAGGPSKGALQPQEDMPAQSSAAAADPSPSMVSAAPAAEPELAGWPPAASAALGGDPQRSASVPAATEARPQADVGASALPKAGEPAPVTSAAMALPLAALGGPPGQGEPSAAKEGLTSQAPVTLPPPSGWEVGRRTDSPLQGEQHPGVAGKLAKAAADKAAAKLVPQPQPPEAAASAPAPMSALPQPAVQMPPSPYVPSPIGGDTSYAAGLATPPSYQPYPGYSAGQYGAPAYGASPYFGYGPSGVQAAYSAQWQQPFAQPSYTTALALPPSAATSAPVATEAGTVEEGGEPPPPGAKTSMDAKLPAAGAGQDIPSMPSPVTAKQGKEPQSGGSPGRSSAVKAVIKRRPMIVMKLPSSLPTPAEAPAPELQAQDPEKPSNQTTAAELPATEVPQVQAAEAQPAPVEETAVLANEVAAPTAAHDCDAGKTDVLPAEQDTKADEAEQSGSQSPKTPLYFRLTDVALGEAALSQGVTAGAGYGSMGTSTPLSTAATVLRGTSAARSGAPAAARTASGSPAWTRVARPAQPTRAPAAAAAAPVPSPGVAAAAAAAAQPRKEPSREPAGAAPSASKKRPAEAVRGLERPLKRTVIRTGCRPPVQQAAKQAAMGKPAAPAAHSASLDSASTSSAHRTPVSKAPTQGAATPQPAAQADKAPSAGPGSESPQAQQRTPVRQQTPKDTQGKEPASAQRTVAAGDALGAQQQSSIPSAAKSAPKEAPASARKATAPLASSSGSKKEAAATGLRPRESPGKANTPAKTGSAGKSAETTKRRSPSSSRPAAPSAAGGEKRSAAPAQSSKPRVFNPMPPSSKRHASHGDRPSAEKQRAKPSEEKQKPDAAKGASRREAPRQQPSDIARGSSHSRRPEASGVSDRRPADAPKHTGSARPSPGRQDRSLEHREHRCEHRSATKPRSTDTDQPHPSSGRDAPGRAPRVRERDRAFGATTTPSSPAALSVRSSASARSAAPAGAKRPREDDSREEQRQQSPAKKPAPSPAKKPAEIAGRPPAEVAKKPAPAPAQKPATPAAKPPPAAAKPAPAPVQKAAAPAARPAPVPVRKPVAAPATVARRPSDISLPASAPAKASSGSISSAGTSGGHQQIPSPRKPVPVPVSAPVAASQGTPAAARQQQPPQRRPSPGSKDRRVQLEEGIAEVRSKLRQLEQKKAPLQGPPGARTFSLQPPPDAIRSGRVVTISSASQPGPHVTIGGRPRQEGGASWGAPAATAPHQQHYPPRTESPRHFHRCPPGPQYGGGPPPEQQPFLGGPPFEERLPQMGGPPGLHMPPVPSLPPYPPPFLPPLYHEPQFPERGSHREQPPQQPPMFDGGGPGGYSGPQQPPWAGNSYLPPDNYPYRPFYEG